MPMIKMTEILTISDKNTHNLYLYVTAVRGHLTGQIKHVELQYLPTIQFLPCQVF